MKRICIYPKDVQIITGKGERYSRMIIQKIKKAHQKEAHQLVTIKEFCLFLGLDYEDVFNSINNVKVNVERASNQ
ncbi:MAG: hypothetical protein KDD03_07935 [Gelidibacter sp.]|nr:hypothetical protein [Gelidibacter sp.]